MAKALVTGAGGFLGRALVKKLLSEGYSIRAVDNNTRGNLETIKELFNTLANN